MNERLKSILVIVATIGLIIFNGLGAKGHIGNFTPEMISDKYKTFVTPAAYAFAVWSLIYLGLIAFSIYQALPSKITRFRNVRIVYLFSCVFNCAWIYFWCSDMISVCLFVIFALLGSLIFINLNLRNSESKAETLFANTPFALYFGWITITAILNFTIWLVSLGIDSTETVSTVFACVLIVATVILGAFMRSAISNSAYPLAVAWALTGIAVKQSGKTAIVFFCAFGVIASLISALSFVLKENSDE
jgi:benzodiazapine receptor